MVVAWTLATTIVRKVKMLGPIPGHFLVNTLEENGMEKSGCHTAAAAGALCAGAHSDLRTD